MNRLAAVAKSWLFGSTKADLINFLGRTHGYRSYLEICTPTTGMRYGEIDRSVFPDCRRLMYRCPDDHLEYLEIDFQSESCGIDAPVAEIRARGLVFDVILVDAWHQYEQSVRDIAVALTLLTDGGTVVVHDCLPPSESLAVPDFREGEWCGVSYKAYLDFVHGRSDVTFVTVDIDFGCGIIRKAGGPPVPQEAASPEARDQAIREYKNAHDMYPADYRAMWCNRHALLNLVDLRMFKQFEVLHSRCRAMA